MDERTILHFNIADFAVAVERCADTSLRDRPLIVAPFQAARSLVYDMSEEAYKEGVRKGMLLKQAMKICKGVKLLPPRVELYSKAMGEFFKELKKYSPLIECGQGDGHFFADVTGTHRLHGPPPDVGWRVRREMSAKFGITPIWSLGSNKLVSKVASRLVKPMGEYIVNLGEETEFLAPLSVKLLPGLTRNELEKLWEFRLTTVGSLAKLSRRQLMVPFGSRCDYLYNVSRGIDETRVCQSKGVHRRIEYEHVFTTDTNSKRDLEAAVLAMTAQAGHLLRKQRQVSCRVGAWLHYSDGKYAVRQASCRRGSNDDFRLQQVALSALERAWIRRTRVRICRLVFDRLRRQSPQMLLFPEPEKKQQHVDVLHAMDCLHKKFGHGVVTVGRQLLSNEQTDRAKKSRLVH